MTGATWREHDDGAGPFPAAGARTAGDLEVPRPLRLALTAGWNLTESVGLPVAAYAVAAWAGGRDAGMVAGLVAIWVTAVIRKVVTGSVPSLLTMTAVELTVQAAVVLATGQLWLFLLQFPLANLAMCVLFARTASGPDPLVARLAAEVVALRQPATPSPGPAPILPGGNLAVGGNLPAAHCRPGGPDDHRASQRVPAAHDRRYRRTRTRRNRRVRAVVPLGPAQARPQAPFRAARGRKLALLAGASRRAFALGLRAASRGGTRCASP